MKLKAEWIAWILVLAGIARAASMVAHEPVAGYANQYDMIRSSACIGLYPDLPAPARFAASAEAPIPAYAVDARRPELCYPSTEVAIDRLALAAWHRIGGPQAMPLRAIGYVKLALLAGAALLLAWALRGNAVAAVLHGLVFAAVITDPVVTLWMNSLYTEFTAIASLYVAVGAFAALALTSRAAYAVAGLLLLSLAALAFSREQFSLLPPALAVVAAPWLWNRSRHLAVAAFGVALICTLMSWGLVPRPDDVRKVNRTDTYLGLVVPASDAEDRALQVLGLPERCRAVVGATWYLRRGEALEQECPEVFRLPSHAFASFLRDEPVVLARSIARVVPTLPQATMPYLGTLAGKRFATIADLPGWLASPVHAAVGVAGLGVFAVALVASLLLGPLALLASLAWARPGTTQPGAGLLVAMSLGVVIGYALLTTVFGDGWGEASRHFLPGLLAMFAAALMAPAGLGMLWVRWRPAPRACAMQATALVLSIVAVAVASAYAISWARSQRLALGVVDAPAGRDVRAPLLIRGWALDPFGVESVDVSVGGVRARARYGEQATPDLHAVYPAYPDAARGWFVLELPASALPPGEAPMRVTVKNREGIVTEIDRRRLVIAP